MAGLEKNLSNDNIARLGADPKRVTQLDVTTNVLGDFTPTGAKPSKFVGQHLEKVRPDLGGEDVIALREIANPALDGGATVTHEFAHRGFDILRKYGVLEPSGGPNTVIFSIKRRSGKEIRFDEESIIRAIDWMTGRDKENAVLWFVQVHPDIKGPSSAKIVLDNPKLKEIINNLFEHAAALQKFIRDDKKSDPNSPIESPEEIENASSFKE